MFRHMAILKFKPDAKEADIAAYFEAFPKLMASLPVIKAWRIGRNEGSGGEGLGLAGDIAQVDRALRS